MALKFADGFPYATAQLSSRWTLAGQASTVSAGGRWGSRYLMVRSGHTNNWGSASRSFSQPPDATIFIQFGYLCSLSVPYRIISFGDGTVDHCYLRESGGFLLAHHNDGTELGRSTIPLLNGTWQQFEIRIVIGDAPNGEVYVKVDNQVLLNLTSKDTRNGGTAYCTRFYLGGFEANQSNNPEYYSDIIVMDTAQVNGQDYCNSLLGPKQVKPCLPTANGNYAQWTPSAGSNYQNVDDPADPGPNGDTDYNKTAGVNNIDSFVVPDVNAGATINAAVCSMYCKLEEPGTAKLKGLMRTGSTNGEGTEVDVPSSYTYLQSFIYVDPVSGVPMTAAEFNAAEFGYKRSA